MGSASTFASGSLLANKYKIIDLLGQGGMGAVYLAENVDIGRVVAVKVLRPELADDPQSLARFKQEARAAAAIGEPGIVEVLDLGMLPDGGAYIVMERLEGETLRERLSRGGSISPHEAVNLIAGLLDTLAAAHDRGIIHRDLKPDNIWLTARPPPLTKILDFGISKFRGAEDMALTRTGVVMGTPLYMSPEQARGSKEVGPTTDIYSIGAILYEALSGQPPFPGESYNEVLAKVLTETSRPLSALRPDVPEPLVELIARMLAKNAGARPPDARTAAQQLRGALVGTPSLAMTPLKLDHIVKPSGEGSGPMARTAPSIAPPVANALTPPPVATRPGEPPTRDDVPAVAPAPAQPAAAKVEAAPPTNGPRVSVPEGKPVAPAEKSPMGIVAALLGGVVVLGAVAFGAYRYLGAGRGEHGPAAVDAGSAHDQSPFPYGTHPGTPEAKLCGQQRCAIYLATEHDLYAADPHKPASISFLCRFSGTPGNAPIADIAVDPGGELWAVTAADLFRVNTSTCALALAAHLSPPGRLFNGLTFQRDGALVGADPTGAVARIDTATGQVSLIGSLGQGLGCSGDIVALADGTLFATATELGSPNLEGDWLVRLDPTTHEGKRVKTLGLGKVYGLAAWNRTLYGFDPAGRVIAIDPVTAESQILGSEPTHSYVGAAMTPLAPER